MWYHTYDDTNHYRCTSDIYLLSCLALEIIIIIDWGVGAPRHGRYVVNSLNDRYKQIFESAMEKLLNTKLIQDDPKIQVIVGSWKRGISICKFSTII